MCEFYFNTFHSLCCPLQIHYFETRLYSLFTYLYYVDLILILVLIIRSIYSYVLTVFS